MAKDLIFCDAQYSVEECEKKEHTSCEGTDAHPSTALGARKSSQECENTGVNAIVGGASKKLDRKGENFGDEVDSLVADVVAKRGNPDAQECGGWQDCGDLSVKIKTQFTGWIRLPLLDGGTELVHGRSLPSRSECI
jgi:hypothetical protein